MSRWSAYFAKSDVKLHDTWFVSGLRGTGSCDFEVDNAFVPMDHMHPLADQASASGAALPPAWPVGVCMDRLGAVPLGIARGAIDTFIELHQPGGRQGSAHADA